MKAFIADIIPKIQQFSEKLDNLTLLANQHWVLVDEFTSQKHVYIFRSNNELLISSDGKVQKAKWEYLGNRSILIDKQDESFLFKHGFFDANILALKRDNSGDYTLFVNENKYDGEINSVQKVLQFLASKYLTDAEKRAIQDATGIIIESPPLNTGNDIEAPTGNPWEAVAVAIIFLLIVLFVSILAASGS